MLFASASFIFLFLPLALAAFYLSPRQHRRQMLLLISIAFYIFANLSSPLSIAIMAVSVTATYFAGLFVAPATAGDDAEGGGTRRHVIAVMIAAGAPALLIALRIISQSTENAYFPLGAAIWLLHCASYIMDIARGDAKPGHPWDSLLYLTCFPLIVIGPVVRYKDFLKCSEQFDCTVNSIAEGMRTFAVGFIEHMAVAAVLADAYERITATELGSLDLTLGLCAAVLLFIISFFALSGLSNMARGTALMFGLRFPEDHGSLLTARTPAEYFSRCFRGLGEWFDDYICSPLCSALDGRCSARTVTAMGAGLGVLWLAVWLKCTPTMLLGGLAAGVLVMLFILSGADDAILQHRFLWPAGWLVTFALATVFWTAGVNDSPASLLELAGSLTVTAPNYHIYHAYIEMSGGRYLASAGIALLMLPLYHCYPQVSRLLPRGLRSVYDGVCTVVILGLFAFSLLFYMPQYPEYAVQALKHFSF